MSEPRPSVVILAGPNGAGKSTAAPALLEGTLAVKEFVNADVIARDLSADDPASAAIAAGRVMLARLRELAGERGSFAFETTLASRTFAPWLRDHDEAMKKYSVNKIGLFGSFARGEQKRGSDIDLLVEFEKPTYDNFYDLIVYLEKVFRRKVQVLTPCALETMRVKEVAEGIRDSVVYV